MGHPSVKPEPPEEPGSIGPGSWVACRCCRHSFASGGGGVRWGGERRGGALAL